MSKQNKLNPFLQFTVACMAMTMAPLAGGQTVKAEVHNMQQAKAIKGTVVDENNEPVIGATILVVGGSTTHGAVTDFDGNFSVNAKPGQKLKITYIGYDEMIVTAKEGMTVQLKAAAGVQL
ncbi:MAG: carboxypeptidase-like regulatory domain-containing protein, partial [Prevotella sp.]|nr:carboxypeptidase-like regulatory domain-containing protein [Prevotella sp.]